MFGIIHHYLAIIICLSGLQSIIMGENQIVKASDGDQSETVTTDPKLLEQYARTNALSFGIFGFVFGLLNLICYIASIYKALRDRKAIELRNSMKRKMKQAELMEQKQKLLAKVTQPDSMNSDAFVTSTVIKKGTFASIHNPDETNPHYFSKSPTLKRASKVLRKSGTDNGSDSGENHLKPTD